MPEGDGGAQPLAGQASAGADLALTGSQNWAARSHRELYDSVHFGNDPGRVGELAHEWTRLGQEISGAAQWMSERLRATEAGWHGEAATAARAALQRLADWSWNTGEAAVALGDQLAQQGQIMEHARASMPEPVKADLNSDLAHKYTTAGLASMFASIADVKAEQDRASGAHARAVAVMTRMDTESRAVDASTLRFVAPPNPVQGVTSQAVQSHPASGAHLPTAARSAARDWPGSTSSVAAVAGGARPSGDGGAQQTGLPQQFAGGGNPEIEVRQASQSAQSTHWDADSREMPRDRHQGSRHGINALTRESALDRSRFAERGRDLGNRALGPERRQRPTRGGETDARLDHQQGDISSHSAASVTGASAEPPRRGTNRDGDSQARSTHLPGGAPIVGRAGGTSTSRGPGDSRRSPTDSNRQPPARSGPVDRTGAGPVSGPGGGGWTGERTAGGTPFHAGAGSDCRSGPTVSSGRGAPNAADRNTAPGSGVASGWAADSDPNKEPGSHGDPAASGPVGVGMAPGPGMGMGGMGGMGAGGQAGQDQERSSKYREGEPIAEVPGADLPPAVLGAAKERPKAQEGP